MAFSPLLCQTRLLSDIMDAQACSHSFKLIHHWIKVEEENSPQTMGPGKGMCKLFFQSFRFFHDNEECKNQALELWRGAKMRQEQ